MSSCNFIIPFSQSPEELITKARKGITATGGAFTGDVTSGDIVVPTPIGTIKGTYTIRNSTINNSVIEITITDKPFFVSCSRIENELPKQLL